MAEVIVEADNLSYKIGENEILENLFFRINRRENISIVGPNGAGKTTLLKVILGLKRKYTGSIKVLGRDPAEVSAGIIGYVPQIKTIDRNFPATSEELVANGLRGTWVWRITKQEREQIVEMLESVGVGYLQKRNIASLSGGELQRVFVARALIRRPQILVLDEPSTGVDMKAESDILKIISDYSESSAATVITVTHDWDAAYYHSDRILMLNRRIYEFDVPEKAFTDDNLRQLFGHLGHLHGMNFRVESNNA